MKGTIHYSGFRPKHTVERAIVSDLERWLSRETQAPPEPCSYTVHFFREGDPAFYYCRVEAVTGECRWHSNEAGKSPLSALAKALKKMRVCRGSVTRPAPIREHAVVA
ncbi:MAG: hypothetical protein ACXVB9_14120 [Bdellovibrionota bacterium]